MQILKLFSVRAGFAAMTGLATLSSATIAADTSDGALNGRLQGDLVPVHDPVLTREGGTYYVFGTGKASDGSGYVTVRTSPDLAHWTSGKGLIPKLPPWVADEVPGAKDIWAPDISFFQGRWHLYYAVSTFGSNRSAVGLFTSPTLDPNAPGYGWRDDGLVVKSTESGDFNAIDPNHVVDLSGHHWLALGSFWSGLKLFRLNPITGKLLEPGEKPISIARRPVPVSAPDPIEAPFIIVRGGYYYLFASYDYCCKGKNSTYYTVVGRSRSVTGPYLGRDGSSMMKGGGTIFLTADLPERQRFRGPGHVGFLHDRDGSDYVVYHAYDAEKQGAPTLRIASVSWTDDDWPTPRF